MYQYCQANPVGYVDPSGHTCEIVQNHYEQYQEYRKQHPKATAAEAYEAVTGKDPLKKDGSGMYGSWVMKAEDIEGLTPLEIQNKFALPNTPKYVCDVELEAGTHIREGEVNPLEGWGSGGGTQYDLIGQRIGNFKNEILLEGN